jgi:hypothetical protein
MFNSHDVTRDTMFKSAQFHTFKDKPIQTVPQQQGGWYKAAFKLFSMAPQPFKPTWVVHNGQSDNSTISKSHQESI